MRKANYLREVLILLWLMVFFISGGVLAIDIKGLWVEADEHMIYGESEASELSKKIQYNECVQTKVLVLKEKVISWQPIDKCSIGGDIVDVPTFIASNFYAELVNEKGVVVLNQFDNKENSDEGTIEMFRFVGPDLFWIYYYGEDHSSREHKRMYFRKVKSREEEMNAMLELKELKKIINKR